MRLSTAASTSCEIRTCPANRHAWFLAATLLGCIFSCAPSSPHDDDVGQTSARLVAPQFIPPTPEVGVWELASTQGPAARMGSAMAYDSQRGVVVMFGGGDANGGNVTRDVWEWNGTQWQAKCTAPLCVAFSPDARHDHAMAYNSQAAVTLLYGGVAGTYLDETWSWNGTAWHEYTPTTTPGGRGYHSLGFFPDLATGTVLLYGGDSIKNNTTTRGSDTWYWRDPNWSRQCDGCPPGPIESASMVVDEGNVDVALFGGFVPGGSNATWTFDPYGTQTWSAACIGNCANTLPSRRNSQDMAYDAARLRTVMFGGEEHSGCGISVCPVGPSLPETWEWDGSTWRLVTVSGPVPGARYGHKMAYDSMHKRTVMFGGSNYQLNLDASTSGGLVSAETWLYHVRGGVCANGCDTPYCVNGTCCEQSACDSCSACNTPGNPGQCAPIPCNTPPDGCHQPSGTCSNGVCSYAAITCTTPPDTCHQPTGTCSNGVCSYAAITCTTPPNACHESVGVCGAGVCSYAALGGTPCSGGICQGGECVPIVDAAADAPIVADAALDAPIVADADAPTVVDAAAEAAIAAEAAVDAPIVVDAAVDATVAEAGFDAPTDVSNAVDVVMAGDARADAIDDVESQRDVGSMASGGAAGAGGAGVIGTGGAGVGDSASDRGQMGLLSTDAQASTDGASASPDSDQQGGCGCRVGRSTRRHDAGSLGLLVAAGIVFNRRRGMVSRRRARVSLRS